MVQYNSLSFLNVKLRKSRVICNMVTSTISLPTADRNVQEKRQQELSNQQRPNRRVCLFYKKTRQTRKSIEKMYPDG